MSGPELAALRELEQAAREHVKKWPKAPALQAALKKLDQTRGITGR
jgi:hypothetical protein